jgi:hypothetical protein
VESPRALANFSIALRIERDGKCSPMETSRIAGNISVILSLTTSFSVYATGVRLFLSMSRTFTAGNACKRSSHRKSSAVGPHCDCCNLSTLKISSISMSEKGSKGELKTCTKYRSCRCSSLHEIFNDSRAGRSVIMLTKPSAAPFKNIMFALAGDLNTSTRPIN